MYFKLTVTEVNIKVKLISFHLVQEEKFPYFAKYSLSRSMIKNSNSIPYKERKKTPKWFK